MVALFRTVLNSMFIFNVALLHIQYFLTSDSFKLPATSIYNTKIFKNTWYVKENIGQTCPFAAGFKALRSSGLFSTIQEPVVETSLEVDIDAAADGGKKGKKAKKQKRGGSTQALEVIVIGLSHHNAKVEVREKLAIPEDKWNEAANALCDYDSISEAAVLSTCNRFELYLSGQNQYECIRDAIDFLFKRAGGNVDQMTLRRNLFMLSGEDAIWHLLKVSAGLDSLVVGEGQILAQVKRAYEHGLEDDGCQGKVVARLLNTAVTAGKRVRSETGISKGAVSISSAAAEFSATKLKEDNNIESGKMADAKITIIGAGKMARLLLVHLATQDVKKVTVVNRSEARVLELQQEFPDMEIEMRFMPDMWDVIRDSDVIYPSTAATTTIINEPELRKCLEEKARTRPGGIQFVDISVPRNVNTDCANIEGVFCYNVDDLKAVVQRNTAKRRREMVEAEVILKDEQGKLRLWQQSLGAIPTIAKLQEKAELLRMEEMEKVSNKLTSLTAKDMQTVEKVTKGIVAKLLHGPMSHLRQQTEGDATRAAIEQVQKAFQLSRE
jgi:glutamyl-tRNA reductase